MYVFILCISLGVWGYWYPTEDFGVEFSVETQNTFFFFFFSFACYSAKHLIDLIFLYFFFFSATKVILWHQRLWTCSQPQQRWGTTCKWWGDPRAGLVPAYCPGQVATTKRPVALSYLLLISVWKLWISVGSLAASLMVPVALCASELEQERSFPLFPKLRPAEFNPKFVRLLEAIALARIFIVTI